MIKGDYPIGIGTLGENMYRFIDHFTASRYVNCDKNVLSCQLLRMN